MTTRALEKIVRGFSCHRRIQILQLLDLSNEAMSLTEIAANCRTSIYPICEHLRRLYREFGSQSELSTQRNA